GSLFLYEQDSACTVSFCGRIDWTGSHRAYRGRLCDGVAAGSGMGAGASRRRLWNGRVDAAARLWAMDKSKPGVGGADSSCVLVLVGDAESACGGGCAEDGSGLAWTRRIDHAVLRGLDAFCAAR